MTVETRLLPPGIDFGATDEPVIAHRWKNMVFDVNGGSHVCDPIYPTDGQAKSEADICLEYLRNNYKPDFRIRLHDGTLVAIAEVSHCLQIPWNRP